MTAQLEDRLEDLPPSAKLVYKVLEYEGAMTKKELVEHTRLNRRTLSEAIERLEQAGIITVRPSLTDSRQSIHSLRSHE